jgi:hypothetical protein
LKMFLLTSSEKSVTAKPSKWYDDPVWYDSNGVDDDGNDDDYCDDDDYYCKVRDYRE